MSSDADVPDSQDSQYHIHGRITETRHTRKRTVATPSPDLTSKRVKPDRRNTPSPLSSFFRRPSPELSKYHPGRLFTKALEKLGRKSPEPPSSSPLLPPARPAPPTVKIIQRGSERLRDEGIVASIQGMVAALLKCEDTHAWLASDKEEADLFISKELQQTYFEAHRLRLGVTESTFLSHYWTRDIRPKVLQEVRRVAERETILPWFIRSSLQPNEEGDDKMKSLLVWALQQRRNAEKWGECITVNRNAPPSDSTCFAVAGAEAGRQLALLCGKTTRMLDAMYKRSLLEIGSIVVENYPQSSDHVALRYRDPGSNDAGQRDPGLGSEEEEMELPVKHTAAQGSTGPFASSRTGFEGLDIDRSEVQRWGEYIEAVKEDATHVVAQGGLGELLCMQLHILNTPGGTIASSTAFGPVHWRTTLAVLSKIYRAGAAGPETKVLIEKILVLGAFRLLSPNYGLYSIMFLHLIESAHMKSGNKEQIFLIRQFGEAWMLSTGHAARSADRRDYGPVRAGRTAQWLAGISAIVSRCSLCDQPYEQTAGFVKAVDPNEALSICVRLRRGTMPKDRVQLLGSALLACQPCLFHFLGHEYHPFGALDFLHYAFVSHKKCKAGRGKPDLLSEDHPGTPGDC